MTPQEFKAWFDGFTEALDGEPSKAQWKRIKARVAEIDGKPVTQTVYLDRYLKLPSYPYYPYTSYTSGTALTDVTVPCGSIVSQNLADMKYPVFNSMQAMSDLGRAEAAGV